MSYLSTRMFSLWIVANLIIICEFEISINEKKVQVGQSTRDRRMAKVTGECVMKFDCDDAFEYFGRNVKLTNYVSMIQLRFSWRDASTQGEYQ